MISSGDYKTIADYVANYVDSLLSAEDQMDDIHNLLPQMVGDDTSKGELDYAVQIAGYQLGTLGNNPRDIVIAVGSLNAAVAPSGDLDSYLATNGLTVKSSFAEVSDLAGYTISNSYIA